MLCLFLVACLAQMPPGTQAEIDRLQVLLGTASDKPAITYQIAQTWAVAGNRAEALEWLERAVNLKVGFDVARDSNFASLKDDPQFSRLVGTARADTPPVLKSRPAFKVGEGDLVPENLAWDSVDGQFYFGSMGKHKIVRCDVGGVCQMFASGLGVVLGMKIDSHTRTLWAANNADEASGLFHYDLATGELMGKYFLPAGPHLLNDLVVARKGDVYVTDTRGDRVYVLPAGSGVLRALGSSFPAANGIALSPDEKRLYVSAFGDGIGVVDIASGMSRPIGHPEALCLASIDGLYVYRDSLIAIQNGIMTPRVVRLFLDKAGTTIGRFEVLERRNPLFDGITTGVLAGNEFYYMANIQDGKRSGAKFDPISILKMPLN